MHPEKHNSQLRQLLMSAKEVSRVENVTGTPNSGADTNKKFIVTRTDRDGATSRFTGKFGTIST